ncbi:MAG: hypothetical protein JRK53_13335 [Deltaproteobacteria bacterium]|nr:hypothetical protein [Deltaproteobacteria bacterium]
MSTYLQDIACRLFSRINGNEPLSGIDAARRFFPKENHPDALCRNLNAAFLIGLCGKSHPLHDEARLYLDNAKMNSEWEQVARFYSTGLALVPSEFEARCAQDRLFREAVTALCGRFRGSPGRSRDRDDLDAVWRVFFPEGAGLFEHRTEQGRALRKKRHVKITRLNPSPISDPMKELLFSANVLLTVPPIEIPLDDPDLDESQRAGLERIREEPQLCWYDHPIQVGRKTDANEVAYGLEHLNRAVAYEKERGTVARDARLTCVLSVSVTHRGLHEWARKYVKDACDQQRGLEHLHVHVVTESDTDSLICDILVPAMKRYCGGREAEPLNDILGVDGEYARHYNFLKAVSAFWQVLIDNGVKGTFKIDLDQVFPQEVLVRETGASAFEHFKTPLWGAEGVDAWGKPVHLGMIAGALVNQEDIGLSLFHPDVSFPGNDIRADEWVFFSALPQALSTEAEMGARYLEKDLSNCLQRIHVTGGTCGIRVDSLRHYRPFTPGFVGRAEDQAYLLSVLAGDEGGSLRYVHADGLRMRHDKHGFAAEAVKAAATGKLVGDYVRVLLYSAYGRSLAWPVDRVKDLVDPFTGCFISRIPFTVVYLRMALKAASLDDEGRKDAAADLIRMGSHRLLDLIDRLNDNPHGLKAQYEKETRLWHRYYDVLDSLETALRRGEPFALELREKAVRWKKKCEINGDSS